MKILEIDASANLQGNSRVLTDYLVNQLTNQFDAETIVRDVPVEPVPVMSADTLIGFYNYVADSDVSDDIKDHVARRGITFKYGENGPEGLTRGDCRR